MIIAYHIHSDGPVATRMMEEMYQSTKGRKVRDQSAAVVHTSTDHVVLYLRSLVALKNLLILSESCQSGVARKIIFAVAFSRSRHEKFFGTIL